VAELIDVEVEVSGPLWDGRVERAIAQGLDEAQLDVARQGVGDVRAELARVLRHPTGHYQGQIQVDRKVGTRVTDGGIVYGPWLAGVSERNRSTRFKGYAHWRRATDRLRREANDIAAQNINEQLRRLG
jgi:hypothetical protein